MNADIADYFTKKNPSENPIKNNKEIYAEKMVKTCGKPVKYFGKNLAIVTVPAAYTKTFTENWVNKQSFLF